MTRSALTSERRMEIYAAMVSNIDMQVGRVIEYLESIGERENTLILFMSDNGAAWSFPPAMGVGADNSLEKIGTRDSVTVYERGWAEAAMAPFREAKNSMAEGGTRTAAFIIHAGLERAGEVVHEYLTMQDVMPTLLDAAQVSHPGDEYKGRPIRPMRGASFLDYVDGAAGPVHGPDEAIGWELHGRRALVRGDWKLLDDQPGPEGSWALYNLATDPGERTDMSSVEPDLFDNMVAEWQAYAEEVGVAAE